MAKRPAIIIDAANRPKLKLPDESKASADRADEAVARASSQAGDATAVVSEA